jgi:hypothetical protein
MALGINYGILQSGGGVVSSFPLDSMSDISKMAGSWSFRKAYASTYETTNNIIKAKQFTNSTEEDFNGSEVEAGDVAPWSSNDKVVIPKLYDQSGNGKNWATTILSNMPVFMGINQVQTTLDDGSRGAESINGSGLEYALGLTGTDGALLVRMNGGTDISYRILRIVGNNAPFITFVGNGSPCYAGVGSPDYETNGTVMTPETRGKLHSSTTNQDVVVLITGIDWTASSWSTSTIQMTYQGNPIISDMTIWNSAPPSGDITLMKDAYVI